MECYSSGLDRALIAWMETWRAARLAQTAAGARLDVMGDYLGAPRGLPRAGDRPLARGLPPGGVWAAPALLAGWWPPWRRFTCCSSARLPGREDLHWAGDAESLRGRRGASIAEKLASRDYTYLLLVLAVLGHLEWFSLRRGWRVGASPPR
mgnify:CR=1 FL=1